MTSGAILDLITLLGEAEKQDEEAAELSEHQSISHTDLAKKSRQTMDSKPKLPQVDKEKCTVKYCEKSHIVNPEGASLLDALVKAHPKAITASEACTKPSRVKKELHADLQEIIKSKRGTGTWLELPQ